MRISLRGERGAAVEVDAAAAGSAGGRGDGDVDGAFDRFEELPEGCGGVVAQHRVLAAGEDGGHPASMVAGGVVSHGVDAAVEAVQAASSDPSRRCPLAHTRPFELPQRDHTVLS
jgi:hypothetical protein